MLRTLALCSPSEHVFCGTLLTLPCTCVNEWHAPCDASEEPCSAVLRWPHRAHSRNLSAVNTDLPMTFLGGSDSKASAYNARDLGSIPGLGRSPREGNGNPLPYSCLENPMDGGAWWATVHGVSKSQTRLSDFTFTFTFLSQDVNSSQGLRQPSRNYKMW